jgi:hypothetical protein
MTLIVPMSEHDGVRPGQEGTTEQARTFRGEYGDVRSSQILDADGNPLGGISDGLGFHIDWQDGPISHPSGIGTPPQASAASVADVIAACLHRVHHLNQGALRCRENSLVITHLEEAVLWLHVRRANREHRGVRGTTAP